MNLTHPLYRYPASMSPALARALIAGLTLEADTVLDPFCGGGTTAVEALASGHSAICSDSNSLACFVTRAKAWPMTRRSLRAFKKWLSVAEGILQSSGPALQIPLRVGRTRLAPGTHGLLVELRDSAAKVSDSVARRFSQLLLIRAGQICFDCRKSPPSPNALREAFAKCSFRALEGMERYSAECSKWHLAGHQRPRLLVFDSEAQQLPERIKDCGARIGLILTSPPYPGVHVLYHRWQIYGRRETSLPYDLLDLPNGHFGAYYTMGSRSELGNKNYFDRLREVYSCLREVIDGRTAVAQVVGFYDAGSQLPRFREAMWEAGYDELQRPGRARTLVSRTVPHRRWYAGISENRKSAVEYLLVHKRRS